MLTLDRGPLTGAVLIDNPELQCDPLQLCIAIMAGMQELQCALSAANMHMQVATVRWATPLGSLMGAW